MKNRGKPFEHIFAESWLKNSNTTFVRLKDSSSVNPYTKRGQKGNNNPCDYIGYKKPIQFTLELKSTKGNTLPFTNIRDNQWEGLSDFSTVDGVVAGVVCWWIEKDVTKFIPIDLLLELKESGKKSIRFDYEDSRIIEIRGKKKRIYFDYDIQSFFKEVQKKYDV